MSRISPVARSPVSGVELEHLVVEELRRRFGGRLDLGEAPLHEPPLGRSDRMVLCLSHDASLPCASVSTVPCLGPPLSVRACVTRPGAASAKASFEPGKGCDPVPAGARTPLGARCVDGRSGAEARVPPIRESTTCPRPLGSCRRAAPLKRVRRRMRPPRALGIRSRGGSHSRAWSFKAKA